MPIYIKSEDDETLAQLKELGFDAQIISDDPMGDLIFYVARMNAKLDNLGQLRHLHKIMQSNLRVRAAAEEEQRYFERLNREYEAKQARFKMIYNKMRDFTDVRENDVWRTKVPPFSALNPQTEADVFRVFGCEVDQHYRVYAIESDMIYFSGVKGQPTLLRTRFEDGATVRLLDL